MLVLSAENVCSLCSLKAEEDIYHIKAGCPALAKTRASFEFQTLFIYF